MIVFWSAANRWRTVEPLDEALACRAFADWNTERPALGQWPGGTSIPYADCIAAVSAQLEQDRGDGYTAAPAGGARVLVSKTLIALVGADAVYLAEEPQHPARENVYAGLAELVGWLSHWRDGDIEVHVLTAAGVDKSVRAVRRSPVPLAFVAL